MIYMYFLFPLPLSGCFFQGCIRLVQGVIDSARGPQCCAQWAPPTGSAPPVMGRIVPIGHPPHSCKAAMAAKAKAQAQHHPWPGGLLPAKNLSNAETDARLRECQAHGHSAEDQPNAFRRHAPPGLSPFHGTSPEVF